MQAIRDLTIGSVVPRWVCPLGPVNRLDYPLLFTRWLSAVDRTATWTLTTGARASGLMDSAKISLNTYM